VNKFSGRVKVVVNQCSYTKVSSQTYRKFKEVVNKYLAVDLIPLGVVVQDSKVPEAVKKQQPLVTLFPESNAAKCINIMASRLFSNKSEKFEQTNIGSFWSRFMGFTKSSLDLSNNTKNKKTEINEPDIASEYIHKNEPKTKSEIPEGKGENKKDDVRPDHTEEASFGFDGTVPEGKGKRFAPLQG